MKSRMVLGVSILLALAILSVPALAASAPRRGDPLPTPTLIPVIDPPYTLEVVGGEDKTLTIPHTAADGFTPGDSTITSRYPRGMLFTLRPTSETGDIQDVILFIRYPHGSGTRVIAQPGTDGTWTAHPWKTGDGQPAWTHFEFYWRVRDTSGATRDTDPVPMDYWDPTRTWFRLATPTYIVYWFGLSDDDPDRFARRAAYAIATTYERRAAGFGEPISYVPIATIYGSRDDWNEIYPAGVSNTTAGGLTSDELGMSVQYVSSSNTEYQIEWLSHVITHEVTHLTQFDIIGGATGPNWWMEGQAEWFGFSPGNYDSRLMKLAQLQDLPTLSREVTRNLAQADGIPYLVYHMGASFVNWFVAHYGLDAHAQVVGLMKQNTGLYDALEQVTGESLFDLENAWRVYIGLQPFSLEDLDPAAALHDALDPLAAVGDVLTLPAAPALVPVYGEPGPRSLVSGQCFAGMQITVLDMGSLDGIDYYKVDCMGQIGWMARDQVVGP